MTIPRKCNNLEAQPIRGAKGWRTNNDNTNIIWNQRLMNKDELQQKNRLGTERRNTTEWWSRCKTVLPALHLSLYSDAAPNYKQRVPQPHQRNLTVNHISSHYEETKKVKALSRSAAKKKKKKKKKKKTDRRHWVKSAFERLDKAASFIIIIIIIIIIIFFFFFGDDDTWKAGCLMNCSHRRPTITNPIV